MKSVQDMLEGLAMMDEARTEMNSHLASMNKSLAMIRKDPEKGVAMGLKCIVEHLQSYTDFTTFASQIIRDYTSMVQALDAESRLISALLEEAEQQGVILSAGSANDLEQLRLILGSKEV